MIRFAAIVVFSLFHLATFAVTAGAGEAPSATPYSGDIWNRSTLTGDWGGLRNQLAEKGVTLDLSVTQIGQGVVGGGKSGAWQYGGRGDIIMNIDSQKLGLWPGAFLNLEAEGNWASAVNGNTGALMPVNSSQTVPQPGENFDLVSLNFTQFLSPYFGLTIGKYATITATSGDMNEFAHGKGDTQFMNMAFNFNPIIAFTVPYSTLGTGLIVLPTKDPKEAIVSFLVLQANGQPNTSGFGDLDGNELSRCRRGPSKNGLFRSHRSSGCSVRLFPTKSSPRSISGWTGTRSRTARSRLRKAPGTFSTILTSIFTSPKKAWTEASVSSDGLAFPTAILIS